MSRAAIVGTRNATAHAQAKAWIDPVCPLCSSARRKVAFREGRFTLVDCRECGLRYVTPRLVDALLIEQVYDASYWRSEQPSARGYRDYAGDRALHERTFERRARAIARHLPSSGRVLDVGCAGGEFLAVMQRRGWDVLGLEPSAPMRAIAAARLGAARVRAGTLDASAGELGPFELITLWDVLEHLPDPVATLRAAARLLVPHGRLVVETQDRASLLARLLGRRWQHYKHLEHLLHFDARTLVHALELAGLRVVARSTRGAGKFVDLRFAIERSRRLHPRLPRWLAPLERLGSHSFYVNPLDEMIVVAELAPAPPRACRP